MRRERERQDKIGRERDKEERRPGENRSSSLRKRKREVKFDEWERQNNKRETDTVGGKW